MFFLDHLPCADCGPRGQKEYGCPSTHTGSNSAFPVFLALYMWDSQSWWVFLSLSAAWMGTISLGRLYLGVHTPLDVLFGNAQGSVIGALWWYFSDTLATFITTSALLPLLTALFALAVVWSFPTPILRCGLDTLKNAVAFLGVLVGVCVGVWSSSPFKVVHITRTEWQHRVESGALWCGATLSRVPWLPFPPAALYILEVYVLPSILGFSLLFAIRLLGRLQSPPIFKRLLGAHRHMVSVVGQALLKQGTKKIPDQGPEPCPGNGEQASVDHPLNHNRSQQSPKKARIFDLPCYLCAYIGIGLLSSCIIPVVLFAHLLQTHDLVEYVGNGR